MNTFRSLLTTPSAPSFPIWGRRLSPRPTILNLGGGIRTSGRLCLAMKDDKSEDSTNEKSNVMHDDKSEDSTNEKSNVTQDDKSEVYSRDMTIAMGAALEYKHELGMNYNFIVPELIVGSCLQTPLDVDKLRNIGVHTIFCLQQNSDLEYFDVDIDVIREYAMACRDIEHIRAEIRDFDAFDLRLRLPTVVGELYRAINRNGGVTYIHCTAGLGRAPSVALAYMFWVEGHELYEGNQLLQSKRPCCPKLVAIKNATIDMLMGLSKSHVTLTWKGDDCSSVEVSGLDIGWGERVPLEFNEKEGLWSLEKDLPTGRYEYKYIVDGEWMCNEEEPMTQADYCNNYVEILNEDTSPEMEELKMRLSGETVELTEDERAKIRKILESDDL